MLIQEQLSKQYLKDLLEDNTDSTKIRLHTILKKSKETILEFYKGTAKVLREYIRGCIQ